jgi:hypothetical protein
MVAYIDSSAVLDSIFTGSSLLEQPWELGRTFSSELLGIECRRAILRERSLGNLDDENVLDAFDTLARILNETTVMELSPQVKKRAGEAFPMHVKTLDALHLSTALAIKAELEEDVAVFSHDLGMNRCARLLDLAAPWL